MKRAAACQQTRRIGYWHQPSVGLLSQETAQLPTLLQVAGSDLLVDPAGSRAFAAGAPSQQLQFHDYSSLYHEIYNEAEPARSEVVRNLLDWLRRHF